MGISTIIESTKDVALTDAAGEILSVEDAATLIIRNIAFSGSGYFDFFSTDDDWEVVYSGDFISKTETHRKQIISDIFKALRNKELKSDSYYYHEGLLEQVFEPEAGDVFLDPDRLSEWLENIKGLYLSDFWTEDVSDMLLQMDELIGIRITEVRSILSACIKSSKFSSDFFHR